MPKRSSSSKRGSTKKKSRPSNDTLGKEYDGHSIFSKFMKKSGFILSNGLCAIKIEDEPNVVIKSLTKKIKAHDDYPEIIDDVVSGFDEYISDNNRFVRAMHNTEFSNETEQFQLYDSMIKLLLQVKDLQKKVAYSVIDKLSDYAETDTIHVDGIGLSEDKVNVPQLIINQFRWLTFSKNSGGIFDKLMEMVYMMPFATASLIISSIPEIVSDSDHEKVALKLTQLLSSSSVLTVVILDAFTSLNCPESVRIEVINAAFKCLSTVKMEEKPVVLKFIMKSLNRNNRNENIKQLLNILDLTAIDDESAMMLIDETLFSSIQFQAGVSEAFLNSLEMREYGNFTPTDFIMIILLFGTSCQTVKKNAQSFVKSKLDSGSLKTEVINKAIVKCRKMCGNHFDIFSSLCLQLIHSHLENLRNAGFHLYVSMFENLNEFCRQEIIGQLVQELGSLNSNIVDIVLKIFVEFSVNYVSIFMNYSLFIKNIVEHLHHFKTSQIRQVYEVLSLLAFADECGQIATIEDDINILIKKQLSHNASKYQYIGVIGAVQVFRVLSSKSCSNKTSYTDAKNVLKLLHKITSTNIKAKALYYDEMTLLFKQEMPANSCFNKKFKTKLIQLLHDDLVDNFIGECETSSCSSVLLQTTTMFKTSEGDKQFRILCPSNSLVFLCSLLSASCQMENDELNAFLTASVQTYDLQCTEKVKQLGQDEKLLVLDSMFYILNWLRECVNGLSSNNSNKTLILQRLKNINETQNSLENLAGIIDSYTPPEFKIVLSQSKSKPAFQTKSKPTEASTSQTDNSTVTDETSIENPEDEKGEKIKKKPAKKSKSKSSVLSNLRQIDGNHLREWDVAVLDILNCDLAVKDQEKTDCLSPEVLLLVCNDLVGKCKYKLVQYNFGKKVSPFQGRNQKPGFDKLDFISENEFGVMATNLLSPLLGHVENLSSVLNVDQEDDDDIVNDENKTIVNCYEHIIECIKLITLWRGNHNLEEDSVKCAQVFADRISTDSSDVLKDTCASMFQYLNNLVSTIPSLKAAYSITEMQTSLLRIVEEHGVCATQNDQHTELREQICNSAEQFLCKDWSLHSVDSDIKINDVLQNMLKTYFKFHNETLVGITDVIEKALCPLLEATRSQSYFPSFTKTNAHIIYGCIFKALTDEVNTIPVVKQGTDESQGLDALLKWNESNKILTVLTRLLKSFPGRSILISAVKFGKIYVDMFIKSALTSCEYMFLRSQDDVLSVLKSLQVGTRQLQHLTCHSKVTKDVLLSKHIPGLKMCLEKLIFQVKGLLAQFKCTEGFWLGNLKNRDLSGEEILTQGVNSEEMEDGEANLTYSESY